MFGGGVLPWGMPLRRDTTARVVTYLPLALADELKDRAAVAGLPTSAYTAALIEVWLAETPATPAPRPTVPAESLDDARRVREDPEYAAWLRAHAADPGESGHGSPPDGLDA